MADAGTMREKCIIAYSHITYIIISLFVITGVLGSDVIGKIVRLHVNFP